MLIIRHSGVFRHGNSQYISVWIEVDETVEILVKDGARLFVYKLLLLLISDYGVQSVQKLKRDIILGLRHSFTTFG